MALKLVSPDCCDAWGGPNRDERLEPKLAFAQALQENPFLEGLKSHRERKDTKEVGVHDLPLCNLIVTKELESILILDKEMKSLPPISA